MAHHLLMFGMSWMDPRWLFDQFHTEFFWVCLAIVFAECGLFFPFLPGDTLLLSLGIFIATPSHGIDNFPGPRLLELAITLVLLTVAAVLGNVVGYEIGRKIGPPLYERDGRILKRKYFDQTRGFFDKHGTKALVIGRFVPFVRTFITVVAGVTRMDRRVFFKWSAIGAVLWVFTITLLGYFLGTTVPWLADNIDYVTLAILAFTVVPFSIEWFRHRRHKRTAARIKVTTNLEMPQPVDATDKP